MPLLKPDSPTLMSLFRSPITGGSIWSYNDSFTDAGSNVFGKWQGIPVLINPGRSLFDPSCMGASVVPRRNSLVNDLKNLLDSNRSVRRECKRFIKSVKEVAKENHIRARVLIVGGGTLGVGVSKLYADLDIDIISFDVYWSDVISFIADGHDIPLIDSSVHGVWVQAVLEHVLDPPKVVAELHRVLCASGSVYAEVPFIQMVHEGPYDFERFSHSGLRWLFRNFDEICSGSVDGPCTALRWAIRYFVLGVTRSRHLAAVIYWSLLWLSWMDRLVPEPCRVLSSSGFFFLGKKSNSKFDMKSIVSYYRGV